MLFSLQLVVAVVTLMLGAGLAVSAGMSGHWWSAMSFLGGSALVSYAVVGGWVDALSGEWRQFVVSLLGVMAVIDVFVTHEAFDMNAVKANSALFYAFLNLDKACPFDSGLDDIKIQGIDACGQQNTLNLTNATVDATKAQYLPPSVSIIDGAGSIMKEDLKTQQCLIAFRKAYLSCPHAFSQLSKEELEYSLGRRDE